MKHQALQVLTYGKLTYLLDIYLFTIHFHFTYLPSQERKRTAIATVKKLIYEFRDMFVITFFCVCAKRVETALGFQLIHFKFKHTLLPQSTLVPLRSYFLCKVHSKSCKRTHDTDIKFRTFSCLLATHVFSSLSLLLLSSQPLALSHQHKTWLVNIIYKFEKLENFCQEAC